MKTISKVAVLALTLALAGALSACGSSASSTSASAASASASAASASAASSAAAASESAQAASASASAAAEEINHYENEFFGIAFNLPEGWTFVDQAEIESMNAQLSGIAKGNVDMIAKSADSSTAVVVTLEEASEKTAGKDAEAYLQAAVDDMVASINGSNVAYESNGGTVEFEGINRSIPAMVTKITNDGAELWIGQACAEVDGAYFNISIVAPTEEDINAIFTYFSGAAAQETSAK